MNPPGWYELTLLALAAYRTFRLVAWDTLLDRPRAWVLGHLKDERADYWHLFITCPYCSGFWNAVAWWAAWLIFDEWAVWAAVPWALSALVAIVATNLDPETKD